MAYLVLVRHGQSEWNEKGLWTGWTDIDLNAKGQEEARVAGELLKGIHFDFAYTSLLKRAQQTSDIILQAVGQTDLSVSKNGALNEKNYGDYTGKNKWEVKEQVGEEIFQKIRRAWDYPIPNGESLKDVYERVVPYYKSEILPKLKENKNILVIAHGNSLRALVKYLDNVPDDKIAEIELATGVPYVYQIDDEGKVTDKEIRGNRENTV